ncbi:hypothetical protein Bca52824_011515 [Brassica carinata]|uniref:Uncharacterized protein n=1 Tax=Brassica carinata TaxID=52824 RepID=A0A8X7WGE3_BRACI|nr:hypothetical protein Bca52824_011515 [Brassica carinata]
MSCSTVDVRLLRFWEARNIRRDDELMSIDMILLDTNATPMPATVAASRVPTFGPHLTAGSMLDGDNVNKREDTPVDRTVLAKVETGGGSQQAAPMRYQT